MTAAPSDTFEPSRLFVYTMEVMQENPGQPITDKGANAADGCTIINSDGVCPETDMPYTMDPTSQDVTDFGSPPSQTATTDALQHKYPLFQDVTNNGPLLGTIQSCISSNTPVLLAFVVFPSFMTAAVLNSGIMPMPTATELAGNPVGGHEVVVVGYDSEYLLIMNSWGNTWGLEGFFKMPLAYLTGTYQSSPLVQQILTLQPVVVNPNPAPPSPTPVPTPVPVPVPAPPSPTPVPAPPSPTPVPVPVPVPPGPAPFNLAEIQTQLSNVITDLATLERQLISTNPAALNPLTNAIMSLISVQNQLISASI